MTHKIDRAVVHAMLDVLIDDAQHDHNVGHIGLSVDSGGGPGFAIMMVTGTHQKVSPIDAVKIALGLLQACIGGNVSGRTKRDCEVAKEAVFEKLKPTKPSSN